MSDGTLLLSERPRGHRLDRPHGAPQRRPTPPRSPPKPRCSETTAEYNYDYAGQDPINNYDLAGTSLDDESGSAGENYFGGASTVEETEARGNAGAKYEGVKQPTIDEINRGNLKDIDRKAFKRVGWNPEDIKKEYLGEKGHWGPFSLKVDTASGYVVIINPEGKLIEVTAYNTSVLG